MKTSELAQLNRRDPETVLFGVDIENPSLFEWDPYDFKKHTDNAISWERSTASHLFRISDWNCHKDDIELPVTLLEESARTAMSCITRYADTASSIAVGEEICGWLRGETKSALPADSAVHLFANATQALFAVVHALQELVAAPHVLLVHPSYYAVHDMLQHFDTPTSSDWRRLSEGAAVSIERIEHLRLKRQFNVVWITEPTYSSGFKLSQRNWEELVAYCAQNELWLVVDMAFGGLTWMDESTRWLDAPKLSRCGYKRCVVIDSPSKRLFTNNLKLALVHGSKLMSDSLEKFSDSFCGGLTGIQQAFAHALFDPKNQQLLEQICNRNVETVRRNFEVLRQFTERSQTLSVVQPDSGFHTMIFARGSRSKYIDSMSVCRRLVRDHGVYALPTNDYYYHEDDPFGIRINLTMRPSRWHAVVSELAVAGLR